MCQRRVMRRPVLFLLLRAPVHGAGRFVSSVSAARDRRRIRLRAAYPRSGGEVSSAGLQGPRNGPATVNAKATLLIVDDEPDVRDVLEEYFVAHGYAVHGAECAATAKRLAAAPRIRPRAIDSAPVVVG